MPVISLRTQSVRSICQSENALEVHPSKGTRILFSVTDKDGNPGGTNAPVVVTGTFESKSVRAN